MRPLLLTLLLLTATAQAQFQILPSPTTADLRGIHAVSPEIAWASGTNGTVLRTTDAGVHWTLCPTPPNAEKLDFRGIQAFDAQTAIVMSSGKGPLSRLYKTTDACATWTLLFINPDPEGFWDAFKVWAYDHVYPGKPATINGFILGDPTRGQFRFFRFYDGYLISAKRDPWHSTRLTMEKDKTLEAAPSLSSAFAASNEALAFVEWRPKDGHNLRNGTIWPYTYLFATGGKDGAKVYTPLPMEGDVEYPTRWIITPVQIGNKTDSSGAFAISLAEERPVGVIVGGDYKEADTGENSAVFTEDGAKTWHPAQTPPHGYRSAIAYSPATKTWITVGPNGTDLSIDDGRNWRALKPSPGDPPDADRNWNALSLPYVVGPHGRIGKLRPTALQ